MKDKLDISIMRDFIRELMKKEGYQVEDLDAEGAIYYMNGNDGTSFDFSVNYCSCEFMVFWKSEVGAIKARFEKDGSITAYCYYDKNDAFNHNKIHTYRKETEMELSEVCAYLQGTFDDHDIYDSIITKWELSETAVFDGIDDDEDF